LSKHRFLRGAILGFIVANLCAGCSSRPAPEGDNDFDQSAYNFRLVKNQEKSLKNKLQEKNIQYIKYGDTKTLIIPTDQYFSFGSKNFKGSDYAGLNNAVKLIKQNPPNKVYVAAFSDDTGTAKSQLHITQQRAETVVTFLWANGIPATNLNAQGYGSDFPVGSNKQVHSSAYNRRIEIQWTDQVINCCAGPPPAQVYRP
jgi:outer membrane protein OmpA-like peptidoglycan-associated protein